MKKCPHCGTNVFKALIKRPGVVKFNEDGQVEIVKEVQDKYLYEVVECLKCNAKLTNEDLIEDIKCSECGISVKAEELKDGLCPICYTLKQRTDLNVTDPRELVKKILELEKQLESKQSNKIEKKIEKAEQTNVNSDNKEEVKDEKKKTKKKEMNENVKTEKTVQENTNVQANNNTVQQETILDDPFGSNNILEPASMDLLDSQDDLLNPMDYFNLTPPEFDMNEPF